MLAGPWTSYTLSVECTTPHLYLINPISVAFSRNSWRFIMMPYFRMIAIPPGRPDIREGRIPFDPGMPRTGVIKGLPPVRCVGFVPPMSAGVARGEKDLHRFAFLRIVGLQ